MPWRERRGRWPGTGPLSTTPEPGSGTGCRRGWLEGERRGAGRGGGAGGGGGWGGGGGRWGEGGGGGGGSKKQKKRTKERREGQAPNRMKDRTRDGHTL